MILRDAQPVRASTAAEVLTEAGAPLAVATVAARVVEAGGYLACHRVGDLGVLFIYDAPHGLEAALADAGCYVTERHVWWWTAAELATLRCGQRRCGRAAVATAGVFDKRRPRCLEHYQRWRALTPRGG